MSKKYKKNKRKFRKKHIVYNNDILLFIHPKIKQIIKETEDNEICIKILKEYSKYKIKQPKYQEYQFYRNEKKPIKEAGLNFYNDAILLTPLGSAMLRANNTMKTKKLTKVHQYVLIFKKGE